MTKDAQIEVKAEGVQPPPIVTPNGETAAAAGGDASGTQTAQANGTGKTIVLPSSAFGRLKKEERERGRREALMDVAKQAGYASVEEFQAFLQGRGQQQDKPTNGTAAKPQAAKSNGNGHSNGNGNGKPNGQHAKADGDPGPAPEGMSNRAKVAWEREREKLTRDLDASRRQAAHNDKKYRSLRKQYEDKETEMSLRESAMLAGVRDVDYAVRLLTRHVDGRSEEELRSFDEGRFFTGLKESHPYLFGEVVRPATTGTAGNGAAPTAPKPGDAAKATAASGQVDAKAMKREEFEALLRKRGLNPTL